MGRDAALEIRVSIRQEGEHFYAVSEDLPGLHVGGFSPEQVCESALRAVKLLFKHNRGMDVDVLPLTDDFDAFPSAVTRCEKFVVHHLAA